MIRFPKRRRFPPRLIAVLAIAGVVLLGFAVYNLPPVEERLSWRVSELRARIKYAFAPPEEAVFTPDPTRAGSGRAGDDVGDGPDTHRHAPSFEDVYELDQATRDKLYSDDVELMLFGQRFLSQVMFGDQFLKVREDAYERRAAKKSERESRLDEIAKKVGPIEGATQADDDKYKYVDD